MDGNFDADVVDVSMLTTSRFYVQLFLPIMFVSSIYAKQLIPT